MKFDPESFGGRIDAITRRIEGLTDQRDGLYEEARVRAREMRREGWSVRQVALALEMPRSTVGVWVVGIGEEDGTTTLQVTTCQRIIDLHLAGRTPKAIAREVGMESSSVCWTLKGMQTRWPHLKMKRGQRWLYSGPPTKVEVTPEDVASWRRAKR